MYSICRSLDSGLTRYASCLLDARSKGSFRLRPRSQQSCGLPARSSVFNPAIRQPRAKSRDLFFRNPGVNVARVFDLRVPQKGTLGFVLLAASSGFADACKSRGEFFKSAVAVPD